MGGMGTKKNYKTHINLAVLTPREHFIAHWLLHKIHPDNKALQYAFHAMCMLGKSNESRYMPSSRIIEYAKKLIAEDLRTKSIGKKRSAETRMQISIAAKNRKRTPEEIQNMRDRMLRMNCKRLICPYCNIEGPTTIMKIKHFENCIYKEDSVKTKTIYQLLNKFKYDKVINLIQYKCLKIAVAKEIETVIKNYRTSRMEKIDPSDIQYEIVKIEADEQDGTGE